MQTKLPLRLDDGLIKRGKTYARRSGKSLSEVVADLLSRLHEPDDQETEQLSPAVRSLVGAMKGAKVSRDDYRKHLVETYR